MKSKVLIKMKNRVREREEERKEVREREEEEEQSERKEEQSERKGGIFSLGYENIIRKTKKFLKLDLFLNENYIN